MVAGLLPSLNVTGTVSVNSSAGTPVSPLYFNHIVIIALENQNYGTILGSGTSGTCPSTTPFLCSILASGSSVLNYHSYCSDGDTDPICSANGWTSSGFSGCSASCYTTVTSGNTYGVSDGVGAGSVNQPNLFSQMSGTGQLSWKGFCEDNCPRNGDHFPFLQYANTNGLTCATASSTDCYVFTSTGSGENTVAYSQLLAEAASASPANLIWFTPTDCHNFHEDSGCTNPCTNASNPVVPACLTWTDQYLQTLLVGTGTLASPQAGSLMGSNLFTNIRPLLWLWWDENGLSPNLEYGQPVKSGYLSTTSNYDEFTTLNTIEANWGLSQLGLVSSAATMSDLFTASTPTSCTNGATNPPTCNVCPPGYTFNGSSCVQNQPPPPATHGNFNQPPLPGYTWILNAHAPGALPVINSNGVLNTTTVDPTATSYCSTCPYNANVYIGVEDWGGVNGGGTSAPGNLGVQSFSLTGLFQKLSLYCSLSTACPDYNLEISLYFYLPTGVNGFDCGVPVTNGGHWVDTEVSFARFTGGGLASPSTYEGCGSPYSSTFRDILAATTPSQSFSAIQFSVPAFFRSAMALQNANGCTQCTATTAYQLSAIEVGTEGFGINYVTADWYNMTLSTAASTSPLSVGFVSSPATPTTSAATTFTATAAGGTAPYAYSWTVAGGAGGSSTGQTLTYTFATGNLYTVTAQATDSSNPTNIATASAVYNFTSGGTGGNVPLTATFLLTPQGAIVGQSVQFQASAAGGKAPYTFSWIFGDGGGAIGQIVQHTFTAAGTYATILTVTDSASPTNVATVDVNGIPGTCPAGYHPVSVVVIQCTPSSGGGFNLFSWFASLGLGWWAVIIGAAGSIVTELTVPKIELHRKK